MNLEASNNAATATLKETNLTTDLHIRRDFNQKQELVWQCFSNKELVTEWMIGPPGWEKVDSHMEFQVGSSFHWKWAHTEDKNFFEITGTYQNIVANTLIQNNEIMRLGLGVEKHSTVSINFCAHDTGTRVETQIIYANEADRESALANGMLTAMEMGYQQIEKILTRLAIPNRE